MTYTALDASASGQGGRFLVHGPDGVIETSNDAWASWLVSGLNYSGTPDGIGTWTYVRVRPYQHYASQPDLFAVVDPAGRTVGFALNETMAGVVTTAMTNYPGEDPS